MKLSVYKIFKENAAKNAKKGRMIALPVPLELGKKLQSLYSDVDGDNVEIPDMHITLGLMHDGNDDRKTFKLLKTIASNIPSFDLNVSDFGLFPSHEGNENKHVLFATIQSEMINKIHDIILSTLKKGGIRIDNGDFPFSPHITLKYCKDIPQIKNLPQSEKGRIDKIIFAVNDKKYPVMLQK